MDQAPQYSNSRTVAAISNVALAMESLQRSIDRSGSLPGLVVLYGPSGYGKSVAACFAATALKAYYITCKSTMTRKSLLRTILHDMGASTTGTIDDLRDRVEEQLIRSGRPLILDEADYLLDRNLMPVVRDIFDTAGTPIMLIGEEHMPAKLRKFERLHGRVLCWAPAQPASNDDARQLATLYAPQAHIADDLLAEIRRQSQGSVRRICVNIDQVREVAAREGWASATLDIWGKRGFYTGEAPARRLV